MNKDIATTEELAPNVLAVVDNSDFDLDPHLVSLMWNEPFFSKVLRVVTKIKTTQIPTAGVLAKDGDIKMWWNPNFLASLTPKQIKGLIKHECWHLIFEHTTSRKHDPHKIWNYAADLAINSLIPEEELPEGGLIPGKAFAELTEEQIAKMGPESVARYNGLSDLIASMPKLNAAEWYFAELMKNEDLFDESTPEGMDDHDNWEELSEEEKELVKGKIKEAVRQAAGECDAKGQWGSVPKEGREFIRQMISNEIPWRSVLKQFCGMSRRGNRSTNVRRLNRKYPAIHPGAVRGYTSSIAVYIDQSGSVSQPELECLFAELKQLSKHTEFTCFHFDCDVDESSEKVWKKGKAPQAYRTRFGGTSFHAVAKHAEANKHRFDGYLVLTDGYADDPGPSRLRRGWVITSGGSVRHVEGNKRDFIIHMKE